jgi:hypothetical protein
MRKFLIALTLALLLLPTLSAGASIAPPGPFSTTGYTTNLRAIDEYPYLVPTEYAPLPGGYVKFHIRARGGPAYDDNPLCKEFYGVTSCEELCAPFGEACGAHGYFEGSFAFDEWGIVDPLTGDGANDGLLTIATSGGSTDVRFGGTADTSTVNGSFRFSGGSGENVNLTGVGAGLGTYAGNAGYAFKVLYTPCGVDGQPRCPKLFCLAHGESLKLKGAKATWALVNDGQKPVLLDSLLLNWPAGQGALSKVWLDGKVLATGSWLAPSVLLDLTSAPAQNREIQGAGSSTLSLQFEHGNISEQPADYTFQAEFAEGCSAIHVAFP